ncbi:MAG: hypothetical protein QOI20_3129 [Acidimicrobiaceae bacterium]|jgi:hypothetical protein|nr:hypothetical protein [Acidimicrobiaceae bacterium]
MRAPRIILAGLVSVLGLASTVINVPAARASGCLVTITGGAAGVSHSCSSWATGYIIDVANGSVLYQVTCNGTSVASGTVTALSPREANTPYGCDAVLTLTSNAASSYAVGFLG